MKKFLKTYNEWLAFPIGILAFFLFPNLYRVFDPTAGAYDIGYLHALVIAFVILNMASGIGWLMFRLNFPILYKYWDDEMEEELLTKAGLPINRYTCVKYCFLIYLLYFFSFLVLTASVLLTVRA